MKKKKPTLPRKNYKAAAQLAAKENAELWAENKKLREEINPKVNILLDQNPKSEPFIEQKFHYRDGSGGILNNLDRPAMFGEKRTPEPLVFVLSPEEQNSKILLAAFHTFKRCLEKLKSKNKDYAKSTDEFSNFHDEELQVELTKTGSLFDTTKLSIRTLIKTKMKRYLNLSARHSEPLNEPLSDTREDMINYLVIEKAWEDRY